MRKTLLTLSLLGALIAGCGAPPASLTMPARTVQGATLTAQSDAFPGLGHVVRVNFGNQWDLHFTSMTQMTYTPVGHPVSDGETVRISITEIRPNVYMVTWQEGDGTTVVHVEDYSRGILYTNITSPGGQFATRKGTLTLTDLPA